MRIVVCIKEVLDPSAVNNYALAGDLKFAADGKTLEAAAVPRLINGYDEQAMEAAMRLRDAGADCRITAVSIGTDQTAVLKHCASLGADEIVAIDAGIGEIDCNSVASLIAAYVNHCGGADLVLCGRQASDDDQGVVPALVAERLDMPLVTLARDLQSTGGVARIIRATPDGDEIVEGRLPAVVTVSNELGTPRFPTAKAKMAARRMQPVQMTAAELGLTPEQLAPAVVLERQFVPDVQGNCEFLQGSPAEVARQLMERLRADRIL